jgi:hypothetical protein
MLVLDESEFIPVLDHSLLCFPNLLFELEKRLALFSWEREHTAFPIREPYVDSGLSSSELEISRSITVDPPQSLIASCFRTLR